MAVVLGDGEAGGSSLALLRVGPQLEDRGWTFRFWVAPGGNVHDRLVAEGREVEGRSRPFRYSWGALRADPGLLARTRSLPFYLRCLGSFLDRVQPSVVHANSLITLPEAALAHRRGLPTMLHVHEIAPADARGWIAARAARVAADAIVAVSSAAAGALRGAGEVMVVHNGVGPVPHVHGQAEGQRLRVGTLGTICARKGSDVFVEAARLVLRERPKTEFRLVGPVPGPPDAAWAEAVLDRARRFGVRHLPYVDPFEELPRWDVFVLPSRQDPFPLASLEAMACGLPVIATCVGGLPEQLGVGGILVDPDNPRQLADAILDLAASPERRRALGHAGRCHVGRRFSLNAQAEGIDRAYRAAISRAA